MRMTVLALACVFSAAACSQSNETTTAPVASAEPAPPFNSDIDVDELMVHVMDPSARAFWAGWAEVYDAKGMHDVSATTEAEWKRVEDGAAAVVLATNTLMLPAYQRTPRDQWIRWAGEVAGLAMQGKAAAEAHDKAAIERVGGKLDAACDACHAAFRKEEPPKTP